MRAPWLRWTLLALAATLLAVLLLGWRFMSQPPAPNPLPMPDGLVALDSDEGQRRLRQAIAADHAPLTRAFVAQQRPAWCGVASATIALNALQQGGMTQPELFIPGARRVRHPIKVTAMGMSLAQLEGLVGAHPVSALATHAQDSTPEAFRALARETLADPSDVLLVNYLRSSIGQERGGHISPVSAWHAESDSLLVMDTAAHKYPPAWVPTEQLFDAMNTVDSASGRSRGWVMVTP